MMYRNMPGLLHDADLAPRLRLYEEEAAFGCKDAQRGAALRPSYPSYGSHPCCLGLNGGSSIWVVTPPIPPIGFLPIIVIPVPSAF